jgi:hypothetical protein
MLSTSAIYKAIALADQFDARSVILKPLGGSPLHHVVEASAIKPEMAFVTDGGTVEVDFFRIEQAANAKEGVFDRSRHDYAMADFVNLGANAVREALYVARTMVAPRINSLLELVTMRLANAPVSDLSRLRISEEEDCPAIYGPNLRKLVDQYANYHNAEPALSISGPELGTGEILKYVETGIASIDEELIPWAAALPEEILQDAYRSFFTIRNGRDGRGFFGRIDKSVVKMVLVYCIARHLLENDVLLEGVTQGLKEYRTALTAIMAQSAHLLTIQMEKNDSAIKNGNMVRSITGTEIRVFPPVYREWLKNGGNTDVLYGMASSGEQKFTLAAISENTDKYMKAWNSYASLITARDSIARMNFLREQLIMSYESILNQPNEEGIMPDPAAVRTELGCFRDVLRGMTVADADDLHLMCLKLVCRSSFCETPAEMILTKMDEESKKNSKLSAREAGALAVIWYISTWVSSLIVLDNA